MRVRVLIIASALAAAAPLSARPLPPATPPGAVYQTPLRPDQRRALFGDLHLHTAMSFDAWIFGTQVTPDQAYRFARGETVMLSGSQLGFQQGATPNRAVPARRAWPLDFMAVTDHSEWMGVMRQLDDPKSPVRATELGRRILAHPFQGALLLRRYRAGDTAAAEGLNPAGAIRSAWDREIEAANQNYQPGRFTTFIAYEWSNTQDGKYNLHRNVIFNADHAPLPFTSIDSTRPEKLWEYMEGVRVRGIDVIAIPHNGNASNGLMYDWVDSDGRLIDERYAKRRALNEPLTELVQNKGQSDTNPALSPNDEFANFEIFDHLLNFPDVKSKPDGSYVRQAYGRGLVIQGRVGVNPYKYGVVGGSDFHNGLSTSDENAYAAGPYGIDPRTMMPRGDAAKRSLQILPTAFPYREGDTDRPPGPADPFLQTSSAGLTGVWAEENNRNSIFAALKRRETFATSGTRIRVRMFAGWRYGDEATSGPDWVARAYAQGVPMGGDMPARPAGAGAPRFILQALKDPHGANLDRIQVIKVWLNGGDYAEKVFDVALSGGRKMDAKGHAAPVGNTVDLKTGAYRNTIGATTFTVTWRDPDFDPSKPAIYYARVLEIPTPRWSTLVAISNRLPIPKTYPATIQERAWTSPIWFSPAKP